MDDVKSSAKSGDVSNLISESADIGKLAGAKKLSANMKNISSVANKAQNKDLNGVVNTSLVTAGGMAEGQAALKI